MAQPPFSFGVGSTTPAFGTSQATPSATTKPPAFGTGFPTTTATGALPAFGAQTSTGAPTGTFGFGAQPSATSTTSTAPTRTFGFGAAAPTGTFGFGAQPSTASATTGAPATGTFGFGAQPSTAAATTTSQPSTTAATPKFSFGAQPSTTAPAAAPKAGAPATFNFGAPSSTTPASGAPSSTQPASFALGSTATTTSTTTPSPFIPPTPASTGVMASFTFPGSSSAASTTGVAGTTPTTTQKPTTTTKPPAPAGGFSFGTTAGTSAPSVSTSAPSTSPKASPKPAATSSLHGKTVEEIISKWSTELEQQVEAFTKQAIEVAKWDRQLMENSAKITKLCTDVQSVQNAKEDLNLSLETILLQQRELDGKLSQIEQELSTQDRQEALHPADAERKKSYDIAEDMNTQLNRMTERVRDMVLTLNKAQDPGTGASNPITQITKILNVHLQSLQWIDERATELEGKIEELRRERMKREHDQDRLYGSKPK